MIIMSIDLGKVRTGLAVCDREELLASPLAVLNEKDQSRLLESIAGIAMEHKVETIVIGLPKNMDGTLGQNAMEAKLFGEKIFEKTKIPVDFFDERGTTITAHHYLNTVNVRGKKRKAVVDMIAAVIILENYLTYRKI